MIPATIDSGEVVVPVPVLVDGFLHEAGPNSMLLKSATGEAFLERLGLTGEIVSANPDATRRYLLKNGEVTAVGRHRPDSACASTRPRVRTA